MEKNDTNGTFSLLEATLAPGNEPPPHVHSREDELFYVLEGEFDIYVVGEEAFNLIRATVFSFPGSSRMRLLSALSGFACSFCTHLVGWKKAFRKMSLPAQNLEPPTEALTYSQSDLEQTARRFREYGVQILSPEKVAEQLPLYPEPVPRSGKIDLIEHAG